MSYHVLHARSTGAEKRLKKSPALKKDSLHVYIPIQHMHNSHLEIQYIKEYKYDSYFKLLLNILENSLIGYFVQL